MSDFDKEAEREKLREKYERDKADREATQRMSDLLLKGATMTNTHCNVCGDPLFRQDGVTFCPTCHGSPEAVEGSAPEANAEGPHPQNEPEGASATADPTGASSTDEVSTDDRATVDATEADDASGTQIDVSSPEESHQSEPSQPSRADQRSESSDTSRGGHTASASDSNPEPESEPVSTSASTDPAAHTSPTDDTAPSPARSPSPSSSRRSPSRRSRPAQSDYYDLEDAQSSLTRALEYFAQEAATTDDPRYAAECLEAAREAAETLSALR